MLKFLLLSRTQIVREGDSLRFVLPQPAIGRVSHNGQRPRSSIDGTKTLDSAKRAQRGILHNVFGVVCIAGEPLRETIGFGHVRQKDFIEHCAIILALHSWDRRLLPARQTIWTIQSLFQHDFAKVGTPEIRPT
jgi:hypothetical protein